MHILEFNTLDFVSIRAWGVNNFQKSRTDEWTDEQRNRNKQTDEQSSHLS